RRGAVRAGAAGRRQRLRVVRHRQLCTGDAGLPVARLPRPELPEPAGSAAAAASSDAAQTARATAVAGPRGGGRPRGSQTSTNKSGLPSCRETVWMDTLSLRVAFFSQQGAKNDRCTSDLRWLRAGVQPALVSVQPRRTNRKEEVLSRPRLSEPRHSHEQKQQVHRGAGLDPIGLCESPECREKKSRPVLDVRQPGCRGKNPLPATPGIAQEEVRKAAE